VPAARVISGFPRAQTDRDFLLVDLGDEAYPGGGAGSAGRLGGGFLRLGLVSLTIAPDPVGVLTAENGAVLSGVRDVVAPPGQPFERVEGLEVAPQGRVHAGAVEDGLASVEIDELLEGEGASDKVGGGVLEVLLVLGTDRLAHVRGEAWVFPGEELSDELVGDGVAI
jgi:hypothetical protein